jgi:hypothetical protein
MIYKNSVRTSHETHYVSATKNSQLMLFRERVDAYFENHMENTDTLCGQNSAFWYVKVRGIQRNHSAVKGYGTFLKYPWKNEP